MKIQNWLNAFVFIKVEDKKIKTHVRKLWKNGIIDEYTKCTVPAMNNKIPEHTRNKMFRRSVLIIVHWKCIT